MEKNDFFYKVWTHFFCVCLYLGIWLDGSYIIRHKENVLFFILCIKLLRER